MYINNIKKYVTDNSVIQKRHINMYLYLGLNFSFISNFPTHIHNILIYLINNYIV